MKLFRQREIMYVIAADDSSRVALSVPNASGTDYINASFIDVSDDRP